MHRSLIPLGAGPAAATLPIAVAVLLTACGPERASLPAMEAPRAAEANALIVKTSFAKGISAPEEIVGGAGAGARAGAREGMEALGHGGGGGLGALLTVPIAAAVGAAIGAEKAHTPAEVDAARAAIIRLGQDLELLASIDRSILDALAKHAERPWECVGVLERGAELPCPDISPVVILDVQPTLWIGAEGPFDPEIELSASVKVVGSLAEQSTEQGRPRFAATWQTRELAGRYFAMSANDAAPMRRRIQALLDRLARRIADDLYISPRPQDLTIGVHSGGEIGPLLSDGVIVRVAQQDG